MGPLEFVKYEGLGNDFLVVDAAGAELDAATVRALCDRHFGVGADGVLVVGTGAAGAAGSMIVLNADGSRPEMCGNGLRCVALHLASRAGLRAGTLVVDTDAGPRRCVVEGGEVVIDMGVCEDGGVVELEAGGRRFALRKVSTGNPHAVAFGAFDDALVDAAGPLLSRDPAFPAGANVELARLEPRGPIDVVVWERGVGRTLACGTGACATLFAACVDGARPWDEDVTVRLPGGALVVRVDRATRRATMRGPARRVFRGVVELVAPPGSA